MEKVDTEFPFRQVKFAIAIGRRRMEEIEKFILIGTLQDIVLVEL